MTSHTLPRYVRLESVRVGETVRVTFKTGDMETSNSGVVNAVFYEGDHISLCTAGGFYLTPSSLVRNVKVTLLKEPEPLDTPLDLFR